MTPGSHQLDETFSAHEHLAPDADLVLERAHEIARALHRRRWAVRATGGGVLAAGIVAGGIAVPHLTAGSGATQTVASVKVDTGSDPSPSPTPVHYTADQEFTAFSEAGYTYDDAVQLASIWNDGGASQAKSDGGLRLLDGETLPIPPSGTPATPETKAQTEFFAAGYDYDDAVTLAGIWHETDVYKVKTEAGQKLLDGETLPIPPSGSGSSGAVVTPGTALAMPNEKDARRLLGLRKTRATALAGGAVTVSPESPALLAYFNAGYDYDDAVQLGKLWNETDITQVKSEAGQKVLDGDTLPVQPSGTPAAPEDTDVAAFFSAGYTYDDAVKLGKLWNETDTYQVKIDAGKKLVDGQTLPIQP